MNVAWVYCPRRLTIIIILLLLLFRTILRMYSTIAGINIAIWSIRKLYHNWDFELFNSSKPKIPWYWIFGISRSNRNPINPLTLETWNSQKVCRTRPKFKSEQITSDFQGNKYNNKLIYYIKKPIYESSRFFYYTYALFGMNSTNKAHFGFSNVVRLAWVYCSETNYIVYSFKREKKLDYISNQWASIVSKGDTLFYFLIITFLTTMKLNNNNNRSHF